MHLIYIDDSKDEKIGIFSALVIPATEWMTAFYRMKEWRRQIKRDDGIFPYTELHAWKFVSGRGQISDRVVPKGRRCQLFRDGLELVARLPGVQIFNTVAPAKQDERAFEWLLNRINRTMQAWDSRALLICDEGKEAIYTRLKRKMGVYNPIPSAQGRWTETGELRKNIPIDRIIEDPFFKKSDQSYFVQMADFCAYALLRRERPLESKNKYGLDKAFSLLGPALFRGASRKDPEGIIRIT